MMNEHSVMFVCIGENHQSIMRVFVSTIALSLVRVIFDPFFHLYE